MLFDPRPKTKREEIFNREKEFKELERNIDLPLIVISGVRRVGKTSILNGFLNEVDIASVVLDLRSLPKNYGNRLLYEIIERALSSKLDKFVDLLKGISSIKILGNEVEIKWKGRGAITLSSLFDSLNKKRVIIAFDEAQKLRGPRSNEILNALAHAYDYDKNLTFIFTGSEVGLLYDFLGVEKGGSPLYGRYHYTLNVERFTNDVAESFLRAGFKEYGLDIDEEVLNCAVKFFDGIPGWLAFFGNEFCRGRKKFEQIKEIAVNVALEELNHLVKERGRRCATVLKAVATGENSWSRVKRYVEEKEGTTLSSSILLNALNSLENLSIIKDYRFLDPVYKEASLRL
ncbi:MAG: ATP-binding protein [Candidatus Bathyarchaeia archaeon]